MTIQWPDTQQAQNARKEAFEAAQGAITSIEARAAALKVLQTVLYIREVGWENCVTITFTPENRPLDLSQDPVFVQDVEKALEAAGKRMKEALGL